MATIWLQLSTRGKVNLTMQAKCCDREIAPRIGEEIHLGINEAGKYVYAKVSKVAHFLLSDGSAVVTCHEITPSALFITISQNNKGCIWTFVNGDEEEWLSLELCIAQGRSFASLGW